MEEKITKILDLILSGLEKTTDIAGTELPLLIKEYVILMQIEAIPIWGFTILTGVFVAVYQLKKHWKAAMGVDDDQGGFVAFCVTMSAILFALGLAFTIDSIRDLAKLQYAPKAALIEKFRGK